ncbi:DUF397 domain-containing protein [Streptomyces chryseus]|uniref:DUF397 domain-containing protein n=1 Tax=Streptomyces chryseus TaxID=68186 RepID=A0ABQ3DME3_9ACTN|nr:DUF397 domain-containing protein [Streptomyces chryseus]GHA98865.1 hypothetical protein GCM10010346_21990 [Streptomyces chryseus]
MITTPDLSTAAWRKSSYSNGDGGDCVEVADDCPGGFIPVRDSKTAPGGPALVFRAAGWAHFVTAVRNGAL